jgi:NAD(P)-dependent dehydrogenase (short-subunit alcohol dehydrogenase family)
VAVTARSRELLDSVAAELRRKGVKASAHTGDVTNEADVERVVSEVVAEYGQIDVLVNNAGLNNSTGQPSEQTPNAAFRQVIDVDLIGVWQYAREVGRHMLARQSGSIINIASIIGMGGTEYVSPAYHASKAAVINLTRSLAVEWADRGVRVNCISPGYFMSEMIREALEITGTRIWVESRTPMHRMGDHHELAGPIVFLASDASSFVTGTNMAVDGGYSAVIGAPQLKTPWLQWTRPGPIPSKDVVFQGIAPLPDSMPREGIPGFHFPIEEA